MPSIQQQHELVHGGQQRCQHNFAVLSAPQLLFTISEEDQRHLLIDKDACLQIISPWTVPPVTAFNNKEKVLAGTFSKYCFPQNVNTFTGRCTAECMASLMSAENTFVQLGERMKMKKFASVAAYEKTEQTDYKYNIQIDT